MLIAWLKAEISGLKKILIFTRTKHRANKLSMNLNGIGISSNAIHGNKSQKQRTQALSDFQRGRVRVLVATDIAARGIDIDNISHVINYELPNLPESYVHRIGRTARAGTEGTAFSFCCADERSYLTSIENLTKQKIEVMEHKYHSDAAKNAKGAAAKPKPKKQFSRRPRSGNKPGNKPGNKKPFNRRRR